MAPTKKKSANQPQATAATANQTVAKKPKRRNYESYSQYIFKVLKQVHPELGISRKGMGIMNNFVQDMFERIASEASELAKHSKRRTLITTDVQSAAKLVLSGELAQHAVIEGAKALKKYAESVDDPHN